MLQSDKIRIVSDKIEEHENSVYEEGRSLVESNEIEDGAFLVCDVSETVRRYQDLQRLVPRIHQFYAIKCNPDPIICKTLASLGCGFECASQKEIAKALELTVPPEKIIFGLPIKPEAYLQYAVRHNVQLLVFDSENELLKIAKIFPDAECLLRIKNDCRDAMQVLGSKFGVPTLDHARKLIKLAKKLSMNLVGVSFHVGVGCNDNGAFSRGIKLVRELFDFGETLGYKFNFVNVGGGFHGIGSVESYTDDINKGLETHFPLSDYPDVHFHSEFGQYYVTAAYTMFNSIIGKIRLTESKIDYVINESVYNSFISVFSFTHSFFKPRLLYPEEASNKSAESKIHGYTIEENDTINMLVDFPELSVGDWIYFHNAGGYTIGRRREYAMLDPTQIFYLCDKETFVLLTENSALNLLHKDDFY